MQNHYLNIRIHSVYLFYLYKDKFLTFFYQTYICRLDLKKQLKIKILLPSRTM